jgi:hypothetical protein
MESFTDIFEFRKTENNKCDAKKQDNDDEDFAHCRIILDFFPIKTPHKAAACRR